VYGAGVDGLPQVRFFSLREANSLIATLQDQFDRARELRDELSAVQSQLADAGHPLTDPEVEVDKTAPAPVQRLQRAASRVLDFIDGFSLIITKSNRVSSYKL